MAKSTKLQKVLDSLDEARRELERKIEAIDHAVVLVRGQMASAKPKASRKLKAVQTESAS